MSFPEQLVRAREMARLTQDDVAAALGVSRAMISYWENGSRKPNDSQQAALAALYGCKVSDFYTSSRVSERDEAAKMLFRRAGIELSANAKAGLKRFAGFLDNYAKLADAADVNVRGMKQSPFLRVPGFDSTEDARRKAEEVRAHLRIGLGPVADVDKVCELLGITVYRDRLGADLSQSISGAFYNHAKIGFAVLVNIDMTPGRRRFTLAHELGHALLHSDDDSVLVSTARKDPTERFADHFAGEFLMPAEGIRRAIEELGNRPRIEDPADVIHLQRYFNVSYATALVRLRQARLLSAEKFEQFKATRPVVLAESLGYKVSDDEYLQDPEQWRIERFPVRFRRLIRTALRQQVVSPSTVAQMTNLTIPEIEDLARDSGEPPSAKVTTEFTEYEVTGVLAH